VCVSSFLSFLLSFLNGCLIQYGSLVRVPHYTIFFIIPHFVRAELEVAREGGNTRSPIQQKNVQSTSD